MRPFRSGRAGHLTEVPGTANIFGLPCIVALYAGGLFMNRIRCQARTKLGEPCKARATPNGYCSIHSDPGRAAELGRRSGESRRLPQTDQTHLSPPRTGAELHGALGLIFSSVSSGQMDARLGRSLAYIASVLVRTTELSDHETRLRAIEGMITSIRSKGDQK